MTKNAEEIAANIRELNTQLEKEKARELELTNNRDLALKAYQTLLQKETEIKSAPQVSNAVTVASQAIPPEMSISRGTVRNVFIAGVLGVVLGAFVIIVLLWWKSSGISQSQASSPTPDSDDR